MVIFSCRNIKLGFTLAWTVFTLGFGLLLSAALFQDSYLPALAWYAGLGLISLSSLSLGIGVIVAILLPENRLNACH
jgi:hypothetical protein